MKQRGSIFIFFENFEILELLKIELTDCQPACSSYSFHQESIQYADMFQGLFMRFLILQQNSPGLEEMIVFVKVILEVISEYFLC